METKLVVPFLLICSLFLSRCQSEARPGEPPALAGAAAEQISIRTLDDKHVAQPKGSVTPKKGVEQDKGLRSGKKDLDMTVEANSEGEGVVPKKGVEENLKGSKVTGRKGVGDEPAAKPVLNVDKQQQKPALNVKNEHKLVPGVESEAKPAPNTENEDAPPERSQAGNKPAMKNQAKQLPSDKNNPTGGKMTSMIVGIVFGLTLLSVLLFVGLKQLDGIRRRREYRKMNDFLIDGMYNDV